MACLWMTWKLSWHYCNSSIHEAFLCWLDNMSGDFMYFSFELGMGQREDCINLKLQSDLYPNSYQGISIDWQEIPGAKGSTYAMGCCAGEVCLPRSASSSFTKTVSIDGGKSTIRRALGPVGHCILGSKAKSVTDFSLCCSNAIVWLPGTLA